MDLASYVRNERLCVVIKPNAKKTEILGYDDERKAVKIAVAAEPEDNKANKELIRFVSKTLKRKVLIERGRTSKEKMLKITD